MSVEVFPSVWRMALGLPFRAPCPHRTSQLASVGATHLWIQLNANSINGDGPIVAREVEYCTASGAGATAAGGLPRATKSGYLDPDTEYEISVLLTRPGRVAPAPGPALRTRTGQPVSLWIPGPLCPFLMGSDLQPQCRWPVLSSALLGPCLGTGGPFTHGQPPVDSDLKAWSYSGRSGTPVFLLFIYTFPEYHLVLMEIIPKSTQTVHFNDVRSSVSTSYPVSSVYAPDVLVAWWWGWGALEEQIPP